MNNEILYEYDEYIIEDFEVDPSVTNYTMVIKPFNNLLPNSLDCATRK